MYYNKNIEVWSKGKDVDIGGGVIISGEPVVKFKLKVDIQPFNSAEAKKDYGLDVDTTDIIFCDVKNIEIGKDLIKYSGEEYEVKEKIVWDDYMEILLKRK